MSMQIQPFFTFYHPRRQINLSVSSINLDQRTTSLIKRQP